MKMLKFVLKLQHLRQTALEAHPLGLQDQQICFNSLMPTVPTFAVRETDVSRHYGGTSGTPLKPLRVDSALSALSSLRGLRGA